MWVTFECWAQFSLGNAFITFRWAIPASFSSFQANRFFTPNVCEKCPSSLGCWDSNPWPWDHESSLVPTRPGLTQNASILRGHHSSVDSSVPTILRFQVQIPSTPSMLFLSYLCSVPTIAVKERIVKFSSIFVTHLIQTLHSTRNRLKRDIC